MSGNGFDRWDDQADGRSTSGHNAPARRRGRRARPGSDWSARSQPGDQGGAAARDQAAGGQAARGQAARGQGAAPRGQRPGGRHSGQNSGGYDPLGTGGQGGQPGPAGYDSRQGGDYPTSGYGRDGYGGQDPYGQGMNEQDPYRQRGYDGGAYNTGAYNSGAYDNGSYNGGAHGEGAYNSGNYNSGAYDNGSYNGDSYTSGSYDGGAYGSGARDAPGTGAYDTGAYRDADNGQGGYGDQPGYGSGGPYDPGAPYDGGYGRDYDTGTGYPGGARPDGAYPDGTYPDRAYPNGPYSDGAYSGNGYSGDGFAGNGYAGNGYAGSGYRDGQYGGAADGGEGYAANDRYAGNGYTTDGFPTDAYPGSRYADGGRDGYDGRGHGGAPGYDTGQPYRGQDPAAGPAGGGRMRAGDTSFGGGYDSDAYGPDGGPADGRGAAGYDAAGFDDPAYRDRRAYGAAAGAAGGDGQYGRQAPVDEIGLTARQRGGEDEIDADDARHNNFFRGFGRGDDDFGHRPPKKTKKRRSKAGMVALFVLVIFVAALAGGGVYAYHWYSARHANYTGDGYGTITVQVKPGDSAYSLATTLVNDGVVASASSFRAAAENSGKSSLLEPGFFKLHKHMNAALAWDLLINPKSRIQSTVSVPDGMRTSKVLAVLAQETGIPLSQFQSALKDTSALGLPSWAKGNPEGFLYPATYNFPPGASALTILKTMVARANTEFAALKLASNAHRAKFTEYQVIIEASLLEAEVPPKYYGQVAEVIDNRLNDGWRLGLDSTVAYAVNKYIYDLSESDLNVNSPYNTTKHTGLPPGPIDSPDQQAISAVLHPTTGGWMYFVTVNKSGLTLFTTSSAQFNAWAQEAKSNGV